MAEYIEREALKQSIRLIPRTAHPELVHYSTVQKFISDTPAADVVKVVRCKNCKHCYQLAPHSEINRGLYFHCGLWRGEETKNVWHKYKKYYADYSLVCADDYCSCGELKERDQNAR